MRRTVPCSVYSFCNLGGPDPHHVPAVLFLLTPRVYIVVPRFRQFKNMLMFKDETRRTLLAMATRSGSKGTFKKALVALDDHLRGEEVFLLVRKSTDTFRAVLSALLVHVEGEEVVVIARKLQRG